MANDKHVSVDVVAYLDVSEVVADEFTRRIFAPPFEGVRILRREAMPSRESVRFWLSGRFPACWSGRELMAWFRKEGGEPDAKATMILRARSGLHEDPESALGEVLDLFRTGSKSVAASYTCPVVVSDRETGGPAMIGGKVLDIGNYFGVCDDELPLRSDSIYFSPADDAVCILKALRRMRDGRLAERGLKMAS